MNYSKARLIGAALASLYFLHAALTPRDWHFIDNVNLIFHEAGHSLFMFFGEFIHVAMGSGFQVLLPFGIALYFWYTDQRVSAAISLMWTGQSLINVSVYAGDAIVRQLPLLGGDSGIHDWNYLLIALHCLRWTPQIAATLSALGFVCIVAGVVLAFLFSKKETVSLTVE